MMWSKEGDFNQKFNSGGLLDRSCRYNNQASEKIIEEIYLCGYADDDYQIVAKASSEITYQQLQKAATHAGFRATSEFDNLDNDQLKAVRIISKNNAKLLAFLNFLSSQEPHLVEIKPEICKQLELEDVENSIENDKVSFSSNDVDAFQDDIIIPFLTISYRPIEAEDLSDMAKDSENGIQLSQANFNYIISLALNALPYKKFMNENDDTDVEGIFYLVYMNFGHPSIDEYLNFCALTLMTVVLSSVRMQKICDHEPSVRMQIQSFAFRCSKAIFRKACHLSEKMTDSTEYQKEFISLMSEFINTQFDTSYSYDEKSDNLSVFSLEEMIYRTLGLMNPDIEKLIKQQILTADDYFSCSEQIRENLHKVSELLTHRLIAINEAKQLTTDEIKTLQIAQEQELLALLIEGKLTISDIKYLTHSQCYQLRDLASLISHEILTVQSALQFQLVLPCPQVYRLNRVGLCQLIKCGILTIELVMRLRDSVADRYDDLHPLISKHFLTLEDARRLLIDEVKILNKPEICRLVLEEKITINQAKKLTSNQIEAIKSGHSDDVLAQLLQAKNMLEAPSVSTNIVSSTRSSFYRTLSVTTEHNQKAEDRSFSICSIM